jgi:uncharacterized protein with PQ loop repeat
MSDLDTRYQYLMNISTGFYLVCYIPELYANYKNKNANFWNVPEKIILFIGTSLSLAYGVLVEDTALVANYGPLFALDAIALGMRAYYACKNRHQERRHITLKEVPSEPNIVSLSQEGDGTVRQAAGTDTPEV